MKTRLDTIKETSRTITSKEIAKILMARKSNKNTAHTCLKKSVSKTF